MTNTQRAAMNQALEAMRLKFSDLIYEGIGAHAANDFEINLAIMRKTLAEPVVEPPFGSKRKAAMAVYVPPFRFGHGYIYDSQNKMVADDCQVESAVASRVRGWGRLGYMPNGAELQDEIGQMIADALNTYYAAPIEPVSAPVPVGEVVAYKDNNLQLKRIRGYDGAIAELPDGTKVYASPPAEPAVGPMAAPLHFDDAAVERFSDALKVKMKVAREKGRHGWHDRRVCSEQALQQMLTDHIAKGDPVDVGNFAMMLWNRGEKVAPPPPANVPSLTDDQYQSEFEAFVNAELGDVAVTDQGRYISPKIQNYWRVWQAAIQKAGIK